MAELIEDELHLPEYHELGNEFEKYRSGKTMDQLREESEQMLNEQHVDALLNDDEFIDINGPRTKLPQ